MARASMIGRSYVLMTTATIDPTLAKWSNSDERNTIASYRRIIKVPAWLSIENENFKRCK